MTSDRCVIFIHIPKTAGMTLQAALSWKFRNESVIRLGIDRPFERLQEIPEERRAQARVLMGHIPYGAHRYLPQPCDYITLFREPIARVISTYRHVIADKTHRLHERVREMDLDEYISSGIDEGTVVNAQTRQIAGIGGGSVDEHALDLAKTHLSSFLMAALTERFDESFILLRRALGWRLPVYVTRNVSPAWTRPVDVSDKSVELITERNKLDLELYDFASRRFQESTEALGSSFRREVSLFILVNRIPNALGPRSLSLARRYLRRRPGGRRPEHDG